MTTPSVGTTSVQAHDGNRTKTWAHNHNGGPLVLMHASGFGGSAPTITTCTYNSNTYDTLVISEQAGHSNSLMFCAVWNNPSTGSNNFTVDVTQSASGGNVAWSIIDGNTTSPVDTSTWDNAPTSGNTDTVSTNLASVSSGSLVLDLIAASGDKTASIAESGGQTEETGCPYWNGVAFYTISGSHEAGSGTVNMGWSWTTSTQWAHMMVAMAAGGSIAPQAAHLRNMMQNT